MTEKTEWEKDSLTGCFTRERLYKFLDMVQLESNAAGKSYSLMLLDLDHFKEMNDKRGHSFGDEVLKYFSSSLRLNLDTDDASTAEQNFIFRYGGDEFIIVFLNRNSDQAYKLAANILRNIKHRPFLFKGYIYKISFSGGISSYPADARTPNELIEIADKAMYHSKKTGRGKITQYNKIHFAKTKLLVGASLIVVAAFLISFFFSGYGSKRLFFSKSKYPQKIGKPRKAIRQYKKISDKNLSTIYLKSGGILKGEIISEGDLLEVRIRLDQGEGSVLLNSNEILEIKRPIN